jgi:hypothetical protein
MKIRVTVMAPKDRCVDSHEYDDALPWPCIADLSLELRGYKEWSAYLRTTDRLTIQIVEEGGFGDVELHRDRDTDAGQTIAEAIGVDFGDVVCVEPDGTAWTLEEIMDGLKAVAEGES